MSRPLIISGMHRSGTSLLASWLERCGLTIHAGRVWGAAPGNPRGHFEDRDFEELHSGQLKRDRPRSRGWIVIDGDPHTFDPDLLERAKDLVDRRNARFALWGWKDPRTICFLDQWHELLPEAGFFFVWRPCAEVVDSLHSRSRRARQRVYRITRHRALQLWLVQNRRICSFCRRHPRRTVLAPLRHVLDHDREILDQLCSHFELPLDHVRLNELFEPELLRRTPREVAPTGSRQGSEVDQVESELEALSTTT